MGEDSSLRGAAALLISAALCAACASSQAPSPSPRAQGPTLASPAPERASGRSLFRSTSSVRTSHVKAELVRRTGGEWVIVKLEPLAIEGPPEPAAARADLPHAGLEEALVAYEQAFERRDEASLAQVWLMNPTQRHEIGRMFRRSDGISVAISDPVLEVRGDRANLAFDQRFSLMHSARASRAFGGVYRRALAASDALGNWDLKSLVEED